MSRLFVCNISFGLGAFIRIVAYLVTVEAGDVPQVFAGIDPFFVEMQTYGDIMINQLGCIVNHCIKLSSGAKAISTSLLLL